MTLPGGAAAVANDEELARYIFARQHLNRSDPAQPTVKASAFLPHPHATLSVFRVSGWTHARRGEHGRRMADERDERERKRRETVGGAVPEENRVIQLYGWALTTAAAVRSAQLDVVPAEPPPHHAEIVGWPALTGGKKADEAAQMGLVPKLMKTSPRFVAAA